MCAHAAVGAVVGDPRLRLRVRCWSAEIIFSNIGARMLDFLEQFPCVLWVCACGFSPSSRELLTRHLRTFLCVALLWADFFFFSSKFPQEEHVAPVHHQGLGAPRSRASLRARILQHFTRSRCAVMQIRAPVIEGMITWQKDPVLRFAFVLSLVKFLFLPMGVFQRSH